METVAVYSERPVRTYGLKAEEGYQLITCLCPFSAVPALRRALDQMDPPVKVTLTGGVGQNDGLEASFCLGGDQTDRLRQVLTAAGLKPRNTTQAVSLIHLQGPHFGDRFGIASEAMAGLREAGVIPLGFSAVVHSLFIILRPKDAQAAVEGLAKRFQAPG